MNDYLFTIEFRLNEQGSLIMEKFHMYDNFMKLSMELQHELINGALKELGESPAYAGREKISLN